MYLHQESNLSFLFILFYYMKFIAARRKRTTALLTMKSGLKEGFKNMKEISYKKTAINRMKAV